MVNEAGVGVTGELVIDVRGVEANVSFDGRWLERVRVGTEWGWG